MDYALNSKGQEVYATDLEIDDKNKIFFCPNENCNGEFQSRAIDSNCRVPHFYFHKGLKPHIEGCWCLEKASPSKYDPSSFILEDFFNKLLTKTSNSSPRDTKTTSCPHVSKENLPIRTLLQLFEYCSNNTIDKEIGTMKISDLIVDYRTLKSYKKSQAANNKIYLYHLQFINYKDKILNAKCHFNEKMFLQFEIEFPSSDVLSKFARGFTHTVEDKIRKKHKKHFIALAQASECIPIPNSSFFKQKLIISSENQVHIL